MDLPMHLRLVVYDTEPLVFILKRFNFIRCCRTNPLSGPSSLNRSWSQLLHSHTVLEKGQNQTGFAAWILASVLLLEGNNFRQAAERFR